MVVHAAADPKADTCRCVMDGCLCCYDAWYVDNLECEAKETVSFLTGCLLSFLLPRSKQTQRLQQSDAFVQRE
jgi:hypothetical protein